MTSPADPDLPCPHEHFTAEVDVNRITDGEAGPVAAFMADLRISCADCGEPFRFCGVRAGMSPAWPMCSVAETELHVPVRPASADPDFGLGIPGFALTARP